MFSLLATTFDHFLLPTPASSVSGEVDWLFWFVTWVTVIFSLLILLGTVWLGFRFRHKPGINDIGRGPTHSNLLEIVWSVIPLIIVLLIAIWGFKGYMNLAILPPANDADTIEINVRAYKWAWEFTYPNGFHTNVLHVPVNTKIRIVQTSDDVIHSLYLPEMRIKKDVVPGRFNKHWFEANIISPMGYDLSRKKSDGSFEELNRSDTASYEINNEALEKGDPQELEKARSGFDIYCTEYCGTGHSRMLSKVYVHPDMDSYKTWLIAASNPYRGDPPAKDVGLKLATNNGCFACHSINGSSGTGPTWKDMYNAPVKLTDGKTVTVDENYVRDSILYPQKEIVLGFGGAMPSFLGKFSDRDIAALVAYMKSISTNFKGDAAEVNQPVPKLNEDKSKTK
ncbi:MAG: Cytochrome c oxidase polypeptide [Phycisphaerales bacterium]|nr:Cytochrome c oxidase polypeptide [Phycisphaerales bacterium]